MFAHGGSRGRGFLLDHSGGQALYLFAAAPMWGRARTDVAGRAAHIGGAVKHLLAVLLTFSAATYAQAEPGPAHYDGYAEPFGRMHALRKQREQVAIGLRVQISLRIASERKEAQYAENRRRCQAALRVAETCARPARTFSCDEKGFKPIPAVAAAKHAVMSSGDRYKMERCVLDAANRDP